MKYTQTRIETCCPDMLGCLLQGVYMINNKKEVNIVDPDWPDRNVKICPYCGEKVVFEEVDK